MTNANSPSAEAESSLIAVRCQLVEPGELLCETWTGSAEVLAADGRTAAYLVRTEMLAAFRDRPVTFFDRGRKDRRKPLSYYLLTSDRIPFVASGFASSGRAISSICKLLARASRLGDDKVCVIGVGDKIFDAMSQRARGNERRGASPVMNSRYESFMRLTELRPVDDRIRRDEKELEKTVVGRSRDIGIVRRLIALAARRTDPTMILGDTGSGKEVAAQAIHDLDRARSRQPFVAVNCGAIAHELFESELFGYVAGAFTGALAGGKQGLWVAAGDGTLFLDEIGDLHPAHQVKILRTLEANKVLPLGATTPVKVNCRVVTATNRDLPSMVRSGSFREDVYYRLRGFVIVMPCLRDHPDDLPLLANHLWRKYGGRSDELPPRVVGELTRYRWHGNARELRSVLVSLASTFPEEAPTVEHLRAILQIQGPSLIDDERFDVHEEARMHRVECLWHLRRVDDVVRACKVHLTPLAARSNNATPEQLAATLTHRLAELNVLDMQPALFHSDAAFDVVRRLCEMLSVLKQKLVDHPADAARYFRDHVRGQITAALAAITHEVERLLKEV